jgi:NAD(P)-dependent dehydrogenase (short-subunit alcohol dehydrogenase family)
MSQSLIGKRIIITGASAGIGAATARLSAQAGMHVLLTARRAERLEQLADECRQSGVQAAIFAGDVTQPGFSEQLLDSAERELGGFDVVFANAGYGFGRPMQMVSDDELRHIFEVNFFAAFSLLREAARRMIDAHPQGAPVDDLQRCRPFHLPRDGGLQRDQRRTTPGLPSHEHGS